MTTTDTQTPAIPSPLVRAQHATGVYLDELVGQHDGGPRRHTPVPVVRVVCEHCRHAFPEGWPRAAAHVERDLVAVHLRRRALLDREGADLREIGDLSMTVTVLLDELADIYTKGNVR